MALAAAGARAEKTDVVTLRNGDRLTGEVKSLERGLLTFKTDTLGTVQIEWDKVAGVSSRLLFEIERSSGERRFGSIDQAGAAGVIRVRDGSGETTDFDALDTVRISQMDTSGSLRDRVDGHLDFGYSYNNSTQISQLSMGTGVSRRNAKRLLDFDLSVIESDAPGTQSAGSASLSAESRRFLGNRKFWSALGRFERNDELGLDLRTLAGAGAGRYIRQTSSQEFAGLAGLAASREKFADGQTQESLELLLGLQYDAFRFDTPELQLKAALAVFPSLTISGRVRTAADLTLRYELIRDFFLQLSFAHAYDSESQSVGAASSDYSVTTSVGYTF
jgi:hypothetical protein